jgi:hypothetical protein
VYNTSTPTLRIPRLVFFLWHIGPLKDHGLPLSRFRHHAQTHRTAEDSSGREISQMQRRLLDNKQNSRETNFHAHGGFRTDNPIKRAASDPRL